MKPQWIVDTYILDSSSVVGDLLGAIRDSGADLLTTKYVPFKDEQNYGDINPFGAPVILYGTHGFVSKCPIAYAPGAFGIGPQMNLNEYMTHYPLPWLFNQHIKFLPFGVFVQRIQQLFEENDDKLFIRPNSGFKTFAGQVITIDNYGDVINTLLAHSSVVPSTWIGYSPVRTIDSEFRFLVVDGEVIDGSEYRWDSILDIRHDWPKEAMDLAKVVARHNWQPDHAYMCDITLSNGSPYVLEINSFACAGLYAMDKPTVVEAINKAAIGAWKEIYR